MGLDLISCQDELAKFYKNNRDSWFFFSKHQFCSNGTFESFTIHLKAALCAPPSFIPATSKEDCKHIHRLLLVANGVQADGQTIQITPQDVTTQIFKRLFSDLCSREATIQRAIANQIPCLHRFDPPLEQESIESPRFLWRKVEDGWLIIWQGQEIQANNPNLIGYQLIGALLSKPDYHFSPISLRDYAHELFNNPSLAKPSSKRPTEAIDRILGIGGPLVLTGPAANDLQRHLNASLKRATKPLYDRQNNLVDGELPNWEVGL